MKKLDKKVFTRIGELLENTENVIVLTDNGGIVEGKAGDALILFANLVQKLSESIPKFILQDVFEKGLNKCIAKEKDEEIKEIEKKIEELLELFKTFNK